MRAWLVSLGLSIWVLAMGVSAQPRRPPRPPAAPRVCPAFVHAPQPGPNDPHPSLSAGEIATLSADIHDHRRDPMSTGCAALVATRLIEERRPREAQPFVNLLADLPQGRTVLPCLDDVETLASALWPQTPFVVIRHERTRCETSIVTRAARLPTRCGRQAFPRLQTLAYNIFREMSDRCIDEAPHPLMQALILFARSEDRELVQYWNEHRDELPQGLPDTILVYTMREWIERGTTSTRAADVLRDELLDFLRRTREARTRRFAEMTRVEGDAGPPGRFIPNESDGIAAAAILGLDAHFVSGHGDLTLGHLLQDLQFMHNEHLLADDRTRRALDPFNVAPFLDVEWTGEAVQRAEQIGSLLERDGASLSLMRLKLQLMIATRRPEDIPRTARQLHEAYWQFQPVGERTVHPGLTDAMWLPVLRVVAERGYQVSIRCAVGCSGLPDMFQTELRWILPRLGEPPPPGPPRIRTVGPSPPPSR